MSRRVGRPCTVCKHPERAKVEMALVGPETYRAISDEFGLSASALKRHRKHHMDEAAIVAVVGGEGGGSSQGATSAYARLALNNNGFQMQRFVDELLRDPTFDLARAARRAGYSPGNASKQGSRLAKRDDVRAAIVEQLEQRKARLGIQVSQDAVLDELHRLYTAALTDFLEWESDGRARFRPSEELGPEIRAVESISLDPDGYVRNLRMVNKAALLKMLAAHANVATSRVATEVKVTVLNPSTGEQVQMPLPPLTVDAELVEDD